MTKKLTPAKGTLNLQQNKFCELYAGDREFFGNGVESYIEAYNPDNSNKNWYKTACSAASRLLTNVKVIDRINEILEEDGLNDSFVDKQVKFLITQHADFSTKLGAIREYNKLRNRITEKSEVELKLPSVVLESVYGTSPKFRTDNSNAQIDDVAANSSDSPS